MTRPVISFNLGATFNEPHILLPGAPANPQETIMSAGINAIAAAANDTLVTLHGHGLLIGPNADL